MAEQTPEKKSWAEISEQIRRLFGGGGRQRGKDVDPEQSGQGELCR